VSSRPIDLGTLSTLCIGLVNVKNSLAHWHHEEPGSMAEYRGDRQTETTFTSILFRECDMKTYTAENAVVVGRLYERFMVRDRLWKSVR